MRDGVSFLDTFLYRYSWPLLQTAMNEDLKLEHLGDIPEDLKIEHEEKKVEERINHYMEKNPQDRLAFMKGLLDANKWQFVKFFVVRACLQIDDYIVPFVIAALV